MAAELRKSREFEGMWREAENQTVLAAAAVVSKVCDSEVKLATGGLGFASVVGVETRLSSAPPAKRLRTGSVGSWAFESFKKSRPTTPVKQDGAPRRDRVRSRACKPPTVFFIPDGCLVDSTSEASSALEQWRVKYNAAKMKNMTVRYMKSERAPRPRAQLRLRRSPPPPLVLRPFRNLPTGANPRRRGSGTTGSKSATPSSGETWRKASGSISQAGGRRRPTWEPRTAK
jgi:hypothetical protein